MNTPLRYTCFRIGFAAILIVSMTVLIGCGGSKKGLFVLKGKVTYKDQPVTGGTLTLHPLDGKSQDAKTDISSDGTYQVVPPSTGEMKVLIETESVRGQSGGGYKMPPGVKAPPGQEMRQFDTPTNLPKYVAIPRKYGNLNSTPLTYTIVSGQNTKDFDLTD